MRTMKDKERVLLITRIFLDLNGPSTAKEISDYIENCPVKLLMWINPAVIGSLLRGQKGILNNGNETRPRKYYLESKEVEE